MYVLKKSRSKIPLEATKQLSYRSTTIHPFSTTTTTTTTRLQQQQFVIREQEPIQQKKPAFGRKITSTSSRFQKFPLSCRRRYSNCNRWIVGITVFCYHHSHNHHHHPIHSERLFSTISSTTVVTAANSFLTTPRLNRLLIHSNCTISQLFSSSSIHQIHRTNHTTTTTNTTTIEPTTRKNMTDTTSNDNTDIIMSSSEKDAVQQQLSVWDGSDPIQFASDHHIGYSVQSDPQTHVGGWNAHHQYADKNNNDSNDWIETEVVPYLSKLDYTTLSIGRAPKILVLYGSLRSTSFSKKLAYEMARLLNVMGCTVRVYNPMGLPVRNPDDNGEQHIKVLELRALTHWSDGHVWVSPEMHGTITGVFKNQIDWIPLNTGSIRPTQGKTCCVAQINGGSQSFNAVNTLRILARWMRMPCCTNQSSVPKAWQEFDDNGRMKPSDYRNRVVDVIEEFVKFTAYMVPISDTLTDRYSERMEVLQKGRLLTQEEKEKQKTIDAARKA